MSQTELIKKTVEKCKNAWSCTTHSNPISCEGHLFCHKKPHAHASRKKEKPDAFLFKFNFNQFPLPHPCCHFMVVVKEESASYPKFNNFLIKNV